MKRICSIFFSLAFLVLPIYAFAHDDKITICHIPPGNPENAHTISIDEHAWQAHEAHGDTMGECPVKINHDPVINGPSYVEGVEDSTIEFTVTVSDPDGDSIVIKTMLPDGATYSEDTGLFQWVPSEPGSYSAKFRACDSHGGEVTLEVTIQVNPTLDTNDLPIFTGPTTATTTVDTVIEFTVTASDPDGDTLIVTSDLPAGASYTATTGLFSWTPQTIGTSTATFFAFDGTGTSTHSVVIEVFPADDNGGDGDNGGGGGGSQNSPPSFVNFHPPHVATSTEVYSYDVNANDPDDDLLTFSLITNPIDMSIDPATGVISWTPTDDQATSTPHVVTVQVSDGQHATSTSYSIIVSLGENDNGGSGGGNSTPPPPIPSPSGGGGGGGGNGPPWPLQPPVPAALIVANGSLPVPPSASTIVPSQLTPAPQIAGAQLQVIPSVRLPVKTETSIGSISISTTATSAPAGGRPLASFLFAGLFNLWDWITAHFCALGWLLWLLTLIAFFLTVFASRKKEETKPAVTPTPAHFAGGVFEESSPDDINQYWETYPQEKG